ncbi:MULTISPECIES: GntR family transcriptional regulator [unclassified Streptomyces]|uniref:GntR family transcriptional regulator n=1 Tax=unclassified Streptomyces TaxID=2593676 RepID=UPI0004BE5B33|nr:MULTISPECIES: GntR family transcriptional regulator [unclassified Streptomyces]
MEKSVNKADQAYDALQSMITFQELPPGAMLSEAALMELTGLGRTPVREALQRLARERMVEIHPNRGVFVAGTSVEAQLKLLELRRSVEELAVRLAAHRAGAEQKEAMLRLADRLDALPGTDLRAFDRALKEIHELIATAAHNEYLLVAMTPLQGLSRRFWFAHIQDPAEELATAASLHGAVLHAIREGDEEKAASASLRLNDYLVEFAYRTLRSR